MEKSLTYFLHLCAVSNYMCMLCSMHGVIQKRCFLYLTERSNSFLSSVFKIMFTDKISFWNFKQLFASIIDILRRMEIQLILPFLTSEQFVMKVSGTIQWIRLYHWEWGLNFRKLNSLCIILFSIWHKVAEK